MPKIPTALAALALLAGASSFAAPITSAADPALAGANLFDFDSLPATGGMFVASVTLPGVATVSDRGASTMYITDTWGDADHWLYSGGGSTILDIVFSSAVSAFGFKWAMVDWFVAMNAYDADGLLLQTTSFGGSGDHQGYAGLSGSRIHHVTLSAVNDAGEPWHDNYLIDQLSYKFEGSGASTAPSHVPEPASLALAALALGGLGLQQRRRRQRGA